MKTLRQIENAILDAAKKRAEELRGTPAIMTENEVIAIQINVRTGEKYVEMYNILKCLDEYLKYASSDGKAERQPLRNKLKEMLEAL